MPRHGMVYRAGNWSCGELTVPDGLATMPHMRGLLRAWRVLSGRRRLVCAVTDETG